MSPEELGQRVATALGPEASYDVGFGPVTVDVPLERWHGAATLCRDDDAVACRYFDWLSAYDNGDGTFAVCLHLWSVAHRHHLLLRTVVAAGAAVDTVTDLWPGAAWHERETYEMFGIEFAGHPNLAPLLLPEGFEGHPLRKEFVLASRVAKAWPGAKEPGESDADTGAPGRRRMLPPGVPDPAQWGPDATAEDGG